MGQPLQHGALGIDTAGIARVFARRDLIDEAPVSCQIGKVRTAAQQQRIPDRQLQMPVRGLDGAVLVATPRLLRVASMP